MTFQETWLEKAITRSITLLPYAIEPDLLQKVLCTGMYFTTVEIKMPKIKFTLYERVEKTLTLKPCVFQADMLFVTV